MKKPLPSGFHDSSVIDSLINTTEEIPVANVADRKELQSFMESKALEEEAQINRTSKIEPKIIDIKDAAEDQKIIAEAILNESKDLLAKMNDHPAETSSTTATTYCPYCSWDQKNKDIVAITDEDKQMWLRHIISGERFLKRYEVFGGAAILEFRSRLVSEQDAILEQLNLDTKAGTVASQQEWVQTYTRYALTVSLSKLITGETNIKSFVEVIKVDQVSTPYEIKNNKNIVGIAAQSKFSLWNDTLFSVAISCIQQFDLLCARLQTLARDQDFFKIPSGEKY